MKKNRAAKRPDPALDLSNAPPARMPHAIRPMLATRGSAPFSRPGWLFEIKWDGYRAIAEIESGQVRLYSRNLLSLADRFAAVARSLATISRDAVLDGELVVVDDQGRAQFEMIQNYPRAGGTLVYYVFDLLYLDGHDLRKWPLAQRKQLLAQILPPLPNVRYCEHLEDDGELFFRIASERNLEGIVAKDASSIYLAGQRSPHWIKIKTQLRLQATIGGFTEPRGGRLLLGGLLLGVPERGKLRFVGQVGAGHTDDALRQLRSRLEPLLQDACPFLVRPKTDMRAHWVRPELECEVGFQNWTSAGVMRQPILLRIIDDTPRDEAPDSKAKQPKPKRSTAPTKQTTEHTPSGRAKPNALRAHIGARTLQLTNQNKIYWPEDGFTKRDLIEYYRAVAEFILPHLHDRPVSLNRHPDGIHGKSFYQKNIEHAPDWLPTVLLHTDSDRRKMNCVLCQDEATLVYLANLGCIELHPWSSRVESLDYPDFAVLDLDGKSVSFDLVVDAARAAHQILDRAHVPHVCKTSGKSGMHIYIPLGAEYSYEQSTRFTELIGRLVHARLPETTSLVRDPARRSGRVYLDYLQNGRGQTIAAVYCVRPVPGAWVSTPLKWSEVKRGLDPGRFTIRTAPRRFDKLGDLWQPALESGINLIQTLDRLAPLLE